VISGVALIGVTLTSALPAPAEQAPDKNGPGVARVSVIQGSAVVQRGDSQTQTAAVRNAPLLPGDYISTGATSRAELQFDGFTAVRLGGNVQARITNNDPNNRQMQLADGTAEIGLVRGGQPIQIDTPSATVRAQDVGDYRISIGKDGSSWVTVRRGRVDVVTPQRTYALEQGRTLIARGSASNPSITYTSAVGFDSFDDFNAKRDQTMIAALSASPNLNPSIAGYDNLDAYGQWQDVAGYGQAWVPDQSADWAPYRDGSWTWEGGYGWTWVGNEPWGWAPYHYGRWFYANGYGWAWYPPAYGYGYNTWSPALVGFFGFGVGVSIGFGYPNLGWCPLAPYESYYPWYPGWAWTGFGWGWPGYGYGGYGYGGGFYGGTRIVNVTNIYNTYRNFRHGGASGTGFGRFQHGTISGHTVAVTSGSLHGHVGTIHGAVPVRPTANNLRFSGRTVGARTQFSKAFDSPRFATNRALAARSSFAEQQRGVSQAIHGTARGQSAAVTRGNEASMRGTEATRHENAPIARQNAPVSRQNAAETRNGSMAGRENAAETRSGAVAGRETAPSNSWQRFDQTRGIQGRDNAISAHAGRTESNASRTESNAPRTESNASRTESNAPRTESNASRTESNAPRMQSNAPRMDSGSSMRTQSTGRASAPSDSWNRFSQERGRASVPVTYGDRDNYGTQSRNAYGSSYSSRNPYESSRGSAPSYGSYSRGSYPSYSRGSAPSYGSYSRGSYPSYSRGSAPSYGSYSRGSYPSYSRGSAPSYGSYSRGSYPSYSRGSAPSYGSSSRGGYSAPHPSGGGGGSTGGGRGVGGGTRGGGGRPPH
jgi:hypothetical protein